VSIDLSRSPGEHLVPGRRGPSRLWASLGLLLAALAGAGVAGLLGFLLLGLVVDRVPAYAALIFGTAALVVILRSIARRFSWIVPWYYLLPAILFLLAFTFLPIALTVTLAFTDYAGVRKGELNVSSETAIVATEGSTITISDPRVFDCAGLHGGCAGARVELYASGQIEVAGASLSGNTLTLAEPLPEGREVTEVAIFLAAVGDRFRFPVVSSEGRELLLERAPNPAMVDLESVGLVFDRIPIRRRVVEEDGARLTLDRAPPENLEFTSVARFSDPRWVGLGNFREIFASASRALVPLFGWNVMFAVATVALNTAVGVLLAVVLNNPALRFKGFYRTLLIIPWALPNIITIQVWKGFLNQNFGAVNRLLMLLDITPEPINWLLGNEWSARAAVLLVNLWLGYPFIMVATLGALSAIPRELYEAARIDGANAWRSFRDVTAPLLRSALVPITLTSFAFNFNNFNIIFLLTDGGPPVSWGTATARGTDILISWAYNTAFKNQGGYAYGMASAISLLIFFVTLAISLVNFRVSGALKEESDR
jgi:arabinogalactan oligomer/maltooligosaccharide transport system permease protein